MNSPLVSGPISKQAAPSADPSPTWLGPQVERSANEKPFEQLRGPYQASWQLKAVDPENRRALHLGFSLLITANGFRRVAEVWGALFERQPTKEVTKTALRQNFELSGMGARFGIGPCEFSATRTRGSILSKGKRLEWDLVLTPRQITSFNLIPSGLKKTGLLKQMISTPQPDLAVTGTLILDGERMDWREAPGMQSETNGSPQSGIRAHCNSFVNERGLPVPFVFEGISVQGRILGGMPTPRFTSLCFFHRGEKFQVNSLRDAIRLKSRVEGNAWIFQAEQRDTLIRGQARFEHRDFAGLSSEDTDGSMIHSASAKLSDLDIQIFRNGKLEAGLRAGQTASIELIGRKKSPYVLSV